MGRDEGRRERWVRRAAKLVAAAALVVLLAAPAAAQALLGGPEIPVNTTTAGNQGGFYWAEFGPAIAADGSGGFTVAWTNWEFANFFTTDGVYARRFNAFGAPLSGEIQVNTTAAGDRFRPAIAADGSGFTVAWTSGGGVYARRFDAAGAPLSGEIPVTTTTRGNPVIAADGSGGFTVAWTSYGQDTPYSAGIYARRFDAAGAPLSGEIPVNATTANDQDSPAIAADGSGGFTVAWTSYGQDSPDSDGVYVRRFDAAGAPLSGEIPVNATTANRQDSPAIAADGSGFTVAWNGYGADGGLFARRFDAAGAPLSGEIPVTTTIPAFGPAIAAADDGGFTVAWGYGGIFARRFDAAGAPLSGEIPLTTTTIPAFLPVIAADGSGGFTVAWARFSQSQVEPFLDFDVYARRFFDIPDTRIDYGPGEITKDTTPTFGFSSDEPGSTFECRLDGSGFSACSSPLTTSPLTDGRHTFEVRAIDEDAKVDPSPAGYSFTVDTVPPDTQIDSGPPEASITNDPTPTFEFSSSEGGWRFVCRLDGGSFSECSSPFTTSPLTNGPHTFEVRAVDEAVNVDPSPASRSFTVDARPPVPPVPPVVSTPPTTAPAGPTGKRAAKIKKCKKRFPGEARAEKRKKCVRKAKKLPV